MNQRNANTENAKHWYKQNLILLDILRDQIERCAGNRNAHLFMDGFKNILEGAAIREYYDEDKSEADSLDELRAEVKKRMSKK